MISRTCTTRAVTNGDMAVLKMRPRLSTAFHMQTTETIRRTM